jgi:TonB family protein
MRHSMLSHKSVIFYLGALALLATSALGASPKKATLVAASVSESDYPAEAIATGIEGDVTVTFTISVAGTVSDCVADAKAEPLLGIGSCAVVRRWQYRPATDNAKMPVSEIRQQSFGWRIWATDRKPHPPEMIVINLERKPEKQRGIQ